jgi:hypothetical protein
VLTSSSSTCSSLRPRAIAVADWPAQQFSGLGLNVRTRFPVPRLHAESSHAPHVPVHGLHFGGTFSHAAVSALVHSFLHLATSAGSHAQLAGLTWPERTGTGVVTAMGLGLVGTGAVQAACCRRLICGKQYCVNFDDVEGTTFGYPLVLW